MAKRPQFTLAVVASEDGYIARTPDHPPQAWASAEEQALFFDAVENADWAIMGRHTHEAADKPHRRRIIFSTGKEGWRRPTQVWLDPSGRAPGDLPALVNAVHPLTQGLILGGTRVHDWFHAARAIDRIDLTIEPTLFGTGLPIFTGQAGDPIAVLCAAGYRVRTEQMLNAAGTRFLTLTPGP